MFLVQGKKQAFFLLHRQKTKPKQNSAGMNDKLVATSSARCRLGGLLSGCIDGLTYRVAYGYRSNPVLEVHHRGLGILHTLLQLAVLAYVIVSLFVFHKFAVFEEPAVRVCFHGILGHY